MQEHGYADADRDPGDRSDNRLRAFTQRFKEVARRRRRSGGPLATCAEIGHLVAGSEAFGPASNEDCPDSLSFGGLAQSIGHRGVHAARLVSALRFSGRFMV